MQLKLFIKVIIILTIAISCPIIISVYMISEYMLNIYILILATIISMPSAMLALNYYIKPKIKKTMETNKIITTGL